VEFWAEIGVFFGGKLVPGTKNRSRASFLPKWDQWLRTKVSISSLPRESRLYLTVYAGRGPKIIPIGWAAFQLMDYKGYFIGSSKPSASGTASLPPVFSKAMWMMERANPIGTCEDNWDLDKSCSISIEFPRTPKPITFEPQSPWKSETRNKQKKTKEKSGSAIITYSFHLINPLFPVLICLSFSL